jgi:hypothetical protein
MPNLWIMQGIRQLISLPVPFRVGLLHHQGMNAGQEVRYVKRDRPQFAAAQADVVHQPGSVAFRCRAAVAATEPGFHIRIEQESDVNCARHPVLAASAALLLITLVGCSSNLGPAGVTTIVFDGRSQTLNGQISCTAQPDGKLVILATDTGQKTARVLLSRAHQLVVEKVGIRVPGASGFTDDSGQMWATKVDNTYKINGWMPPNAGEMARHQFEIETTCRYEVPLPIPQPDSGGYGSP